MDSADREERRKLAAESARKHLAEGTWPEVMAVFGYLNPRAPKVPEQEFARLKTFYEQAKCPNIAAVVELVRLKEQEAGVTISFNLSLRRRSVPGEAPEPTSENAQLFFSCPDILVGTRRGVEGAAVWFKNFSEAIPQLAPESIQMMDKIFGEALVLLKGPSRKSTVGEMMDSVLSGEGKLRSTPEVLKH